MFDVRRVGKAERDWRDVCALNEYGYGRWVRTGDE